MPIHLLIDLDDTLLINPINSFMPRYLELLSGKLAQFVPPEKMVKQLLAATEKMVQNTSPAATLEQVFDTHFYPSLGLKKSQISSVLNDFYLNEFNALQRVTSARPEAQKLIHHAVSMGYPIIVATNPLFPQTAMRARLNWAGFSEDPSPFQFVTSYESMHFAKPNPAYYAEILGTIGFPNSSLRMIGNSLTEDILPTSIFGIPSFWVDGKAELLPEAVNGLVTVGTLDEVIPWLESLQDHPREIEFNQSEAILAILRATPAVIHTLTASITETIWKKRHQPADLSILELASHLRDVETEINLPRIQTVLSTDNPYIVGIDSDAWVKERDYQSNNCSNEIVLSLQQQRSESLGLISNLTDTQWMRPARHSIFGPTTLMELVKFVALHDLDHIRQIFRLLTS